MKNAQSVGLRSIVALCLLGAGCAKTVEVTNLRCECQLNPIGIDEPKPALSWNLSSGRRGVKQSAYQIRVASSPDLLSTNRSDLWDSGKVATDRQTFVEYAGRPLPALADCYWTVRTWDESGRPTDWSAPAHWRMTLLNPADWQAKWIAARTLSPNSSPAPNGYHALESKDPSEPKWVQVDLGRPTQIDQIIFDPAQPNNYRPRTPGFGFPVKFKVEVDGRNVYETTSPFVNPGPRSVELPIQPVIGRVVRVTSLRSWIRKDNTACFALSELRVLSAGKNVAGGKPVTAKDSVESAGWGLAGLTDGRRAGDDESLTDTYAAPIFRKSFTLAKEVKQATVTICGLGYYELYLNGRKVGDHVLDPGFTRFDKRILSVSYDVTNQLRQGGNVAGVMLGGGWYELATPDLFGDEHAPWTAPPKVRAQLDVTFADGSRQTIVTDDTWKRSTADITFQCLRGGETHDNRLARPGWSVPGYDAIGWLPAIVVDPPAGKIVAQKLPPIKTAGDIPVKRITEPRPGIYVFELAENTAGWARFTTTGSPGQKITLRFAETLNKEGLIDRKLSSHTFGRWQVDEMILAGRGPETFEPRFCYHGFQFVQVEGLSTPPKPADLVGVRVHTAVEPAGTFECADPFLNRLHDVMLRTYLANLHSIPTDCPQREKMGWMCDGMVAAELAMQNFDAWSVYEKWTSDMEDAQGDDGSMPSIVPTQGWSATGHAGADFQCPWWGGATVVVPWNLYQIYGDQRLLARHYPAMRAYVDSLTARSNDGIIDWGLGDWLEAGILGRPVRTPTALTSTAAYAWYARIVSDTAQLLNKPDDAAKYATLSEQVRAAFNAKWLRADHLYGDDTQTAPALALDLRLAPDAQRDAVAQGLLSNLTGQRHDHPSTGLVGTLYLFKALQDLDRNDLAYRAMTVQGEPGFRHMLDAGATTLWEDWHGGQSRNHPALGSAGLWLHTGLLGIRPASAGYKTIAIKPGTDTGLQWAKGSRQTPHGRVSVSWKVADQFTLDVTIPPNATADVYVPTSDPNSVQENGKPATQSDGVKLLRINAGTAVYAIGSGTYHFVARASRP